MNSIVEHGVGNKTEVRNDRDTVERTGEEHKDAGINPYPTAFPYGNAVG